MYLASVADLRSQLGFDDMTDINTAIGDALDAAEVQLQSILRTEFRQATLTDQFYIQETPRLGRAVKTELLLTRGFLQAQPTSIIVNEISPIFLTAFDEVQAMYGGQAGPLPNFIFGMELGHGIDTTNWYNSTYINVTYTAGFPPDTNTPDSYLISSVPQWLQQGAKLLALMLLADAAPVTEAGIVIDKKMTEQQARLLLQRKIRYKPNALDPFSEPTYS
jgi:hypothetical protein